MNPVRTLGPAIAADSYKSIWIYMLGPVLGCVSGATAYTAVRLKVEECTAAIPRSFRR